MAESKTVVKNKRVYVGAWLNKDSTKKHAFSGRFDEAILDEQGSVLIKAGTVIVGYKNNRKTDDSHPEYSLTAFTSKPQDA